MSLKLELFPLMQAWSLKVPAQVPPVKLASIANPKLFGNLNEGEV
jgi:hypothetical protein